MTGPEFAQTFDQLRELLGLSPYDPTHPDMEGI